MTKDEFIFKKLARVGDCWHKWKRIQVKRPKGRSVTIACIYCNAILSSKTANPDFTTWEGFGWMWERVIEKEWFFEFFKKLPVNTFWRAEIAQTMHLLMFLHVWLKLRNLKRKPPIGKPRQTNTKHCWKTWRGWGDETTQAVSCL